MSEQNENVEMTDDNPPSKPSDNNNTVELSVQQELEKASITAKQRIGLLLRPCINCKVDQTNNTLSFTVVPESIRTYFYIAFYMFAAFAMVVTMSFNNHHKILDENLIKKWYGANNICIFWDDPPFSYMAAFFFIPTITLINVYLIFDAFRVYFNLKSGHYANLTDGFFKVYIGFSCFTGLGVTFFIQSFATQPSQFMPMHAGPFLFLTYGLWTLAFFHFLYFLKIGIIKKGHKYYYLGIAYCVAMGIVVVVKTAIDAPNTFGARTFEQPGWEWTADATGINDKFFMVIVTIMPFFIYFLFVDDLDHVQVTLRSVPAAVRSR